MSPTVLLDVSGGIGRITLNRPDALNACDTELKESLLLALTEVHNDHAIRAVVLTGAGRAFCVGQDLREHQATLDSGTAGPMRTVRRHYNAIARSIVNLPKPVIAAVNGVAAGAGAAFAFAADLRIAADDASFLLAFANVGLSVDSGTSWLLPRLVGQARAAALCLLAEPVTATQALEMGLVNAVVPADRLETATLELAGRLAAGPTTAYAAIKESLRFAAQASFEDALDREADLQDRAAATEDHRRATAAFIAKEQPRFTGA